MKGAAFIVAGILLIIWLATNLSDPAPSAKYLMLLSVGMIAAGVWIRVDRGR